MTRTPVWMVIGALLMGAGCADPEMEKRVADLEKRLADAEDKLKAGGAGAAAAPVNDADEAAAAELYKAANSAAEQMKYDEAKTKLAELKAKYPQSRAARAAQRLESELAVVGKPAGELQVEKWYKGELASLNEGKATLLVFWEVWCPHCKREVPKLSETYTKYHPKGLEMVGLTKLTRNTTEDQATAFISENNVAYPMAKEQGDAMSQHFGVRGIPAAAMVKDGKVVWRGHPARLTDQMLNNWLDS